MDLKDWILTKVKPSAAKKPDLNKDVNNIGGAITPKTIPEFVIPRADDSSKRENSDVDLFDNELMFHSVSPRSSFGSNKTSPGVSPNGSACDVPYTLSAPGSPRCERKGLDGSHKTSKSMNFIVDTNADPLSIAAMSLPHFKSKTSFGFTTLTQSPHTRRKESLFHMQGNVKLSTPDSRRLKSLEALSIRGRPDMIDDVIRYSGSENCLHKPAPSVIVTPSKTQSGNNSPVLSSPEHRKSNNYLVASRLFVKNGNVSHRDLKRNIYYRRRSSLLGLDVEESSNSSLESLNSSNEGTDREEHCKRNSVSNHQSQNKETVSVKRHSAPLIRDTSQLNGQAHKSVSCTQFPSTSQSCATEHGELKFAFQYLAASKQLKLTLLKAENLGGSDKKDSNLNPYAKVYLMPGKNQKQTSELFKHTRNPVFNQNFYFQGLLLEQLHAMTLRIKIFHKSHNLRPPEFIGRNDIDLDSFDLLTENRMWKELDGIGENEDLGSLEISMRFEPRDGCLVITVYRAARLPEHQIKGPPDPYVKVEVSQPGKAISKKVTKTKKSTPNPVFNETYTFSVSFKMDDISYTYVTLTVFNHERIKSDDSIGQVRLGYVATQKSEVDHWREMMQSPGQEISKWHNLLDADDEQKLKL